MATRQGKKLTATEAQDGKFKTLNFNEGRVSIEVEWKDLRDYILDTTGLVAKWYLHMEGGGAKKVEEIDQKLHKFRFLNLLPGQEYHFELNWIKNFNDPRYSGVDKFDRYYLDNKTARSFGSTSTSIGNAMRIPADYLDAEQGKYVLWNRLRNEVKELNQLFPMNLLIVGDAGAGKTSFLNVLITAFSNNTFNPKQAPEKYDLTAGGEKHVTQEVTNRRLDVLARLFDEHKFDQKDEVKKKRIRTQRFH